MRSAGCALVMLALAAPSFAEATEDRPASAPAFAEAPAGGQPGKASAAVKIDFRALTEEGHQVTDLKRDEITLKVNGKPRQIQSLALSHATAAGPASGGSTLPPPYASNAVGKTGRVIHVLVDDDSISPGRDGQVREALRLLIGELAPGDMLGLLTTQGQINLRPSADITRIQRAADGLVGRGPSNESAADAQCRTTRVLAALGTMLSLTGGTPTTVVLFSAGLAPPEQKAIDMTPRRNPTEAQAAAARSDVCPVRPEDFENVGQIAGVARADLYIFHLTEGMVNRSSSQDAGVESLAGVTSAEYVRLPSTPQTAVSRLLRETAAYYTATFEPEPSERTGGTFRVEVRSTREKTKLRARPSVAIAKDIARAAAAPKDMLRSPAAYADLPLRATVHSSRLPGTDEVKVMALFETVDPAATLSAASVGLFDEKNTLKKQWTAQAAELKSRPVMAALSAPAGTYRVRVAAVDASGRAGATDYELKVEVPRADPLKLSTLVLGTQKPGGGFLPRLDFANDPIAIGMLEIYGVPKTGAITVELDVVQTAEGPQLATAQTTVVAGDSEDMRRAFGGFSIASLAPGDYLMRAVVSLDGKPVGKVVRTLRKSQ